MFNVCWRVLQWAGLKSVEFNAETVPRLKFWNLKRPLFVGSLPVDVFLGEPGKSKGFLHFLAFFVQMAGTSLRRNYETVSNSPRTKGNQLISRSVLWTKVVSCRVIVYMGVTTNSYWDENTEGVRVIANCTGTGSITLSVRACEEDHLYREKAFLRTTAGNDCRFLPTEQSEILFLVEATFMALVHTKKDSSYYY